VGLPQKWERSEIDRGRRWTSVKIDWLFSRGEGSEKGGKKKTLAVHERVKGFSLNPGAGYAN